MASLLNMSQRLQASSTTALNLSNKFYKIVRELPSAEFEYTEFAEQFLYISAYLEQLRFIVPAVNPTLPPLPPLGPPQTMGGPPPLSPMDRHRTTKLFEDLVKLLDFLDDAFADSKECLPQRCFDGAEVELILPHAVESLLEQIEALGIASNLIFTVLQLGTNYRPLPGSTVNYTRITEGFVNQTQRMVRTLTLSQPKDSNNGLRIEVRPNKRSKTHAAITQFLAQMLKVQETKSSDDAASEIAEAERSSGDEESSDSDDDEAKSVEKVNTVKFERIGRDSIFDQNQYRPRRQPDQVYARVSAKDIDEVTLKYFGLSYTKPKACVSSSSFTLPIVF
jgi:hypothetical protein